jgi:hypothetical protein
MAEIITINIIKIKNIIIKTKTYISIRDALIYYKSSRRI